MSITLRHFLEWKKGKSLLSQLPAMAMAEAGWSVRSLPNPVPRRIIVARHEHIPVLARRPRTPHSGRPSPHHLRVMSTLIRPRAGVTVVAIPAPLPDPRTRRLARLPRLPVAPEDVLPVWTSRVLQPTVAVGFSLQRPPLRVARQFLVPLQRRQTQLSARRVLGL